MASKIKTLVFVCLTGVLAFGSTGSFALINGCPDPAMFPGNGCDLSPTIKPGSFPYFSQAVDVKYKETSNGFKIQAKFLSKSHLSSLSGPDDVFDINNTKFKLKAVMKNDELSGTVSIKGKMKDLGIKKQSLLMKADLMDFANDENILGFNTDNIVCHQAIIDAVGCTSSESVYLSLIEDIFESGASKVRTAGVAVTTVPVPAAVWLFASGLLGLAGMARRRARV